MADSDKPKTKGKSFSPRVVTPKKQGRYFTPCSPLKSNFEKCLKTRKRIPGS